MSTLKLLLCTMLCLWIYFLWSRRKYYLLLLKIPGPWGYPLIGMAHKLINREETLYTFEKYARIYGHFFFSWLGPFPFVVLVEPQLVQDVLTSPHCISKGSIYEALDESVGRGLFSLNDPEWSRHRKLLNPAFGSRVLLSFIYIFNEETNSLLRTLDALANKGEVDLTQIFPLLTLKIATRTTMGKNLTTNKSTQNERVIDNYQYLLEIITEKCFAPWLRWKIVRKLLGKHSSYDEAKTGISDFIEELVRHKLMEESTNVSESGKQDKNIFINIAVELLKKGDFTMQNVKDESNVIIFGAFETTSNTLAYTLMLLAMFPEYQQRVYEELLSFYPSTGEFDVSYTDIQHMTYLDMVLNEAMRVMAPVPVVARQASQDIQLSNGIVVPKGAQFAIDIFHMHRRKDIWGDDAHIFNPDNFLPSNLEGKHAYAFIPFTKGIRNCIGSRYALLSSKVTLAKLLRNYRFTTTFKFEDLFFIESITLKFTKVPLIEIERRT